MRDASLVPVADTAAVETVAADAAGDGSTPDGSTTWCQSHAHLFCADFDGDLYTAAWDDSIVVSGGEISRDTIDSTSAPAGFLSAIPGQIFTGPQARLERRFAPRPTEARLEFDVLLRDPLVEAGEIGEGPVEIFSILQQSEQYLTGIKLMRSSVPADKTYLVFQRVSGASLFDMMNRALPTGRWVHVALTYEAPGTSDQGVNGSVDLKFDGINIVSFHDVISTDYNATISTSTVFSLGLRSAAGVEGLSVAYDNVALDLTW